MSLIKKQKWENLFKRRELLHTAACKEFYANLTVFIYKKKEIAKSRVKGVEIEFDSMKLASILDVPRHTVTNHELPYGDWMSMIFDAFGVPLVAKKGEEPKRYAYFEETFLTMYVEEPEIETPAAPEVVAQDSAQQKEIEASGVDPSGGPSGHLPESVMNKLQDDLERARAD
ncbi:hypothetical protein Dimus_000601 [Dionaea muscipula]